MTLEQLIPLILEFVRDPKHLAITAHLLGALLAGGLIGLERSFHGRPAGFRTHTLVCTASSLLMLVTLYQSSWLTDIPLESVRTDPTRMAQGIMTGIGFLGAGVIYKEGFSVRGLTTAASIWMTAAIGVLMGTGFYFPAILATILTLSVLAVFRRIEGWMPSQSYAHFHIQFDRAQAISEDDLRTLLGNHGFTVATMSYRILNNGDSFEYRTTIRSTHRNNITVLADNLRKHPLVRELRISPSSE